MIMTYILSQMIKQSNSTAIESVVRVPACHVENHLINTSNEMHYLSELTCDNSVFIGMKKLPGCSTGIWLLLSLLTPPDYKQTKLLKNARIA